MILTKLPTNSIKAMKEFLSKFRNVDFGDMLEQFNEISNCQDKMFMNREVTFHVAASDYAFDRNRYRDILCYDSNRIKLQVPDSVTDEEERLAESYINASEITIPGLGYNFIAAQGPLTHTIEHWWQMVCEQSIVMLCKLIEHDFPKCEQYYPTEVETPIVAGNFTVSLVSSEKVGSLIIRTMSVKNSETPDSEHTLKQIHFSDWPDHGVPGDISFIFEIIDKLESIQEGTNNSVVAHCSAGCGRTGTCIVLTAIRRLLLEGKLDEIDLKRFVIELRRQRISSVQSLVQYQFLYKCLITLCDTLLKENELMNSTENVTSNDKQVVIAAKDDIVTNNHIESAYGEVLLSLDEDNIDCNEKD
uniref:Protein-tyrosine phosphatase n=1 Tax=Rhabditophanes sp. KR3021 TaxID=114890 RepID=A0AC35U8C3_9BILA